MSFKFNFNLAADEEDLQNDNGDAMETSTSEEQAVQTSPSIPAKLHTLDELISLLPPHISFAYHTVPISSSKSVLIPRRELYDVKMQLMSEDSMSSTNTTGEQKFTAAFTDEDIRTNAYEGGLKSWECSSDLVTHLATDDTWKSQSGRIIELGCGTALPSCYILQEILSYTESSAQAVHLTLGDFNIDVLRLVTLPNLILAYAHNLTKPSNDAAADDNPEHLELELTPELITSFTSLLNQKNITIDFLSGPWSPEMISLIHESPYPTTRTDKLYSLLLASETIYSPSSVPEFINMIEHILNPQGIGYIAAKDVYFGVGGSVSDFVKLIEQRHWKWSLQREFKRGAGVGRVVGAIYKA